MSRLEVSPGEFDRVAETFVKDLSESYGLNFQLVDLSEVRTSEQFEEAVEAAGWREWTP